MRIERLTLRSFRNYRDLILPLLPGLVVFVGDNGQGKTNLIEAVHVALRGSSFRAGKTEDFISSGAEASLIKLRIERGNLGNDLEWRSTSGRKTLEWNGKRTNGIRLAREFPFVLFSPESLASIKEGPEHRRILVDDALATDSDAAGEVLRQFSHALKTRNRVLKNYKRGDASKPETLKLLESLDGIYLPLCGELSVLRLQMLRALTPELRSAFRSVTQSEATIDIEYLVSTHNATNWDREKLIDTMHQRSIVLRFNELESGVSLVGPHRHDIRFLFAGKDSRYFCSQGQQRALILSYKMAQIMYHQRTHHVFPFLLLDDVLSELDPEVRTNLVSFLRDVVAGRACNTTPSQIFLTTTDLSFSSAFEDRNYSVYRIEKGAIASARDTESLRRDIHPSP